MADVSASQIRRIMGNGHSHITTLLESIGGAVLEEFASNARMRTLADGEPVEAEGAIGTQVGYVCAGALAMVMPASDGPNRIMGVLFPTDMFGRLTEAATAYRLVSIAPSRLLCFDRRAFEAMLLAHPALERMFLISVLDELDAARDWILLLSGTNTTERLASLLVLLARRQAEQRVGRTLGPTLIRLPISRKHTAECLGIRPESLSRALHRLAQRKRIRILNPATFEVDDLDALIAESGQDSAPCEGTVAQRRAT